MKKNDFPQWDRRCTGLLRNVLRKMKITLIILFWAVFQTFASGVYSQNSRLSMSTRNATIESVLQDIEDNSDYYFLYNGKLIDVNRKVSLDVKNEKIEDVLNLIFKDSGVKYEVFGRQIVLSPENMVGAQGGLQQTVPVKGKVSSSTGDPLPGVTILVKGTSIGTITDADGVYSINTEGKGNVLVFSFIGMKPVEVTIDGRNRIDVKMQEETIGLDEVVAIGYGTQKKVNLTGAVSSVSGDEMLKRPVTNPATMIQGEIPGLRVIQNSGEPGNEDVTIRIRGLGTFSDAGSDPLVLIDGVEGNLTDLNPRNIESISVLKDAASASIYGARAANGVILVTTKVGKEGYLNVEYSGSYAIHTPTKMFDLITNSAEYMELWNEAKENTGLTSGLYTDDEIELYKNATDRNLYPNTDWLDLLFDPSPTQTHNLNFSGGKNGTFYDVSMGFVDQKGVMKGFNYKKYNLRFNIKSQINDRITFGANISLKNGVRSQPGGSGQDIFLAAMSQAPTYAPQLPDGSGKYTYKAYSFEYNNKNPLAVIDNNVDKDTKDYVATCQMWLDVKLLKSLSWYMKGAVNADFSKSKYFGASVPLYNYHSYEYMSDLDVGNLGLDETDKQTIYKTLYSYLKFDQEFNGGHTVNAQIGYSLEENDYQWMEGYRKEYVSDNLRQLSAGSASTQTAEGSEEEWALMSFFGRLGYNYKDRYLLEVNGRYDGTSRLSRDSRWGFFPSFSAGWRMSEETFFKNLNLSWINNLKIRGSYGKLGNQNIGVYPYQSTYELTGAYSFDNSSLSTGVAQTTLSNKDLKWESTTVTDFGLDLLSFNHFSLTFDWYQKKTTDILRTAQVTALVGLDAPYINDGIMKNTGGELSLSYRNSVKSGALRGLNYNLGFNIDHYKNKLVRFGDKEIDGYYLREEGKEWNSFYMLKWIGIFQDEDEIASSPTQFSDNTLPGDLKFEDTDGNGVVNNDDRVPVKGQNPDFEYGINLAATWKGFDFSCFFQGVKGRKLFVNYWGTIPFFQGTPPTVEWRNRWTEDHPSKTMPRMYWYPSAPTKITRNSTYFLQDASYLRLKNLSVGYSLPQAWINRLGVENIRFYFSGDNLFTITDYPGLDPERSSSGYFVNYPQNKVYAFGIDVKF